MSATFIGGTKERDRRTIPERMATYFLTAISLANLFSPGSTNEVEAAGLSETATTIPLRKPGDDIPRPERSTVMGRGKEGRREEGGKGVPDSPYPLEDFSGKTKNCGLAERRGLTQNKTKGAQRVGLMFGLNVLSWARLAVRLDENVVSVRTSETPPSRPLAIKSSGSLDGTLSLKLDPRCTRWMEFLFWKKEKRWESGFPARPLFGYPEEEKKVEMEMKIIAVHTGFPLKSITLRNHNRSQKLSNDGRDVDEPPTNKLHVPNSVLDRCTGAGHGGKVLALQHWKNAELLGNYGMWTCIVGYAIKGRPTRALRPGSMGDNVSANQEFRWKCLQAGVFSWNCFNHLERAVISPERIDGAQSHRIQLYIFLVQGDGQGLDRFEG